MKLFKNLTTTFVSSKVGEVDCFVLTNESLSIKKKVSLVQFIVDHGRD